MSSEVTLRDVVVGVDNSEESDAAVRWARAMADPDARISAVHAWRTPVVSSYDAVLVTLPDDVEQIAARGLQERLDAEHDDRLVPALRQGHAGRSIVEEADAADLIVVGHRGESRLSMMLGSTANYVVHHTERPVVIVRGDHDVPPKRVVVGVDDFEDPVDNPSVRALRWAIGLPGVEHVTAMHSWYVPPLADGVFPASTADIDAMDAAALGVAERVVASVGPVPDGVTVAAESARGAAGFALVAAAWDADLVVVGRRGRGGFSELLLGSTSAEVAAQSPKPVALIR